MEEYIKEHTIMMLKPDSFIKGLEDEILSEIKAKGFTIKFSKQFMLTPSDIVRCFLHADEGYISYLTSQPVKFFILSRDNAIERMYELKYELRKKYGVFGDKENLIHSTDEGTEFHLLLHYFFSELDAKQFCSFSDYDLWLPDGDTQEKRLLINQLDYGSTLKYCNIRLCSSQDVELAENLLLYPCKNLETWFKVCVKLEDELGCIFDIDLPNDINSIKEMYRLWKTLTAAQFVEHAIKCSYTINLLYIPLLSSELAQYRGWITEKNNNIDELISGLAVYHYMSSLKFKYDLKGINCHRFDYSLLEAELYMDLGRLLKLNIRGGSGGIVEPGYFSITSKNN